MWPYLTFLFSVDPKLSNFWKRSEAFSNKEKSFFYGTTNELDDGSRCLTFNEDHTEATIRTITNVTSDVYAQCHLGLMRTNVECSTMFMDGRSALGEYAK